MSLHILIVFSLFITSSYANTIEFDYCIADLTIPRGPTGYSCKDPAKATADDFAYSGLRTPGSTSNIFKSGLSPAFVDNFPALNGMGISMIRADVEVGGAAPLHTHRVAELAIVAEGTIVAGFIDTNNTAYYKTLEKGDMFIFPPTLVHFAINVGRIPAVAYASFASANPGFQAVPNSLFANDLLTDIIARITLLDPPQIKKLKLVFGGTN